MRKKASRTDGQTDRRTDGQTDRQTNRKQYPLFTGDKDLVYFSVHVFECVGGGDLDVRDLVVLDGTRGQ